MTRMIVWYMNVHLTSSYVHIFITLKKMPFIMSRTCWFGSQMWVLAVVWLYFWALAILYKKHWVEVWHQEERVAYKKLSDEVLAWLSGARCKWFAYGPADATATSSSLASLKSSLVLPVWCRLTRVVLDGEAIRRVSVSCSAVLWLYHVVQATATEDTECDDWWSTASWPPVLCLSVWPK